MYGVITTVPAPVEMYDAVHAEMVRRAGTSIDGLLVHVGRATTEGFQTLEVWDPRSTAIAPTPTSSSPCCGSWLAISPRPRSKSSRSLRPTWACHPARQRPDLGRDDLKEAVADHSSGAGVRVTTVDASRNHKRRR